MLNIKFKENVDYKQLFKEQEKARQTITIEQEQLYEAIKKHFTELSHLAQKAGIDIFLHGTAYQPIVPEQEGKGMAATITQYRAKTDDIFTVAEDNIADVLDKINQNSDTDED